MSDTPEMDRLIERLFGDPNRKLRNFHVSWGPEAANRTPEERARSLNFALDQVDNGDAVEWIDEYPESSPPKTLEEFLRDGNDND